MNKIYLLLLSLLPYTMVGQYTDIINSNLSGNSQSAYAVGSRVLQMEGGLWYEHNRHKVTQTEMHYAGINYAVRYGLFRERLEAMLDGTLACDKTLAHNATTTHFGLVNNTIGAKYLLFKPKFSDEEPNIYSWKVNDSFHWRNLTPPIALYAGTNSLPNERYYYESVPTLLPRVAAIFQAESISRVVTVLNLIGDRFLTKESTECSYILTVTHNLDNDWFSILAEQQGVCNGRYHDQITHLGVAFIASINLQLNADSGIGWNDTPQRYMGLVGASYRVDNHNSYIEKALNDKVKTTKIKHKKKPKRRKKNSFD